MEAQDRDAPLVHDFGIDLAPAVAIGNHLTASREAQERSIQLPILLLEIGAISAAEVTLRPAEDTGTWHPTMCSAELNVVAAREVELLLIIPPGHVQVSA